MSIAAEAAQAGREDSLGCCAIVVRRGTRCQADCSQDHVIGPAQRNRYAAPGEDLQEVEHATLERHGEEKYGILGREAEGHQLIAGRAHVGSRFLGAGRFEVGVPMAVPFTMVPPDALVMSSSATPPATCRGSRELAVHAGIRSSCSWRSRGSAAAPSARNGLRGRGGATRQWFSRRGNAP